MNADSHTSQPVPLRLFAYGPLAGTITVPGDKSISHRSLMFGALAVGETIIDGLLEGEDVLATAAALRACGADITRTATGRWHVHGVGVGGLLQPRTALDMGNSGTSTRLLMGLFATHPITVTLTGDASLSRRPMARVTEPLTQMGATFTTAPGGCLPLTMVGAALPLPIRYVLPVASAQVKSAVLLAGLNTPGRTTVVEKIATRDHSERMLAGFGAQLHIEDTPAGREITITGEAELRPQQLTVPGDPSSAAFPLVAALIVPGSSVTVTNVGINPTRDGLLRVLAMMGADITQTNIRSVGGETVADVTINAGVLTGIEVPPDVAPSMIDEFPILFVAAAFAHGRTTLRGLEELRVKESDRLATMAAGLIACGARVTELPDGLIIDGSGGEPLAGGATVAAKLDHRIAMSFAILGLNCRDAVTVDDARPIATSFPDFLPLMAKLGASKGQ
ncbi:3-phosphoshikimate 1-carboxyvinyltransferase [Polymorphobacter arshaanensis]|uniref:3-phosphoshikimate 1-carboxyvinyltransferase n=1 Tax=Glacieibacterium arshaanense TaxID=2511025 RepID=A0A4Y9EPK2_9SPHN|nr:3-phosphoshikimate 1-carboxyvinyltransferase [Polymorphobacter arshaanensis]TFU03269.1 3-phosphoshikimate 1-carboxyvinyltransferase [Polymorphobacter arshaanensis]